uniref:Fanconi anaemia group A protein N-terminal domain-containing protein n=1 Tax=Anopheles atroparvus TaxID=41427 RepID=A0AAG5D1G8_ANOAO
MGYASLQHIVKETHRRIEMMDLPYEEEFRCQLKHLGFKDREIVKETFLRQEWNLGSARVLRLLQEANILTATEFILSLDSVDLTQQVMNDLLEAEYELLANVIQFAHQDNQHSQILSNILKESFGALITELMENPNVIPRNYLVHLKAHLKLEKITMVKQEHLQLILTGQHGVEYGEAIGQQDQWRNEMEMLSETIFGGLIVELVADKDNFISLLKQFIDSSSAISMRYTLYLLNVVSKRIGTDRRESIMVRDFMKFLFRMVVDTGLLSKMQLLLLFAREICATNEAILGTYSEWYKQTIGEMTYRVKKDQFIRMIEMLTGMLSFESNLDILSVHSTIAISAPAKCNDFVVNYKQLCRAHMSQLKPPDVTETLDE